MADLLWNIGLPGTVGVVDGLLGKLVNRELLDLSIAVGRANGNNGRLKALGDDHSTGTLGVLLGQHSQLLGNFNDVLGAPLVTGRVGESLTLVAAGVVGVRQNAVQLVLEELGDEGSREVEHKDLVLGGSLLGESQDGGNADSQVVATDVEDLSLLDEGPDVGLLQVLDLVLIGSSEVSAHAAVVAGDDDTALAGGLHIVDTVLGVNASLLTGLLQDLGILILTDAANVDDGVVREQVLN